MEDAGTLSPVVRRNRARCGVVACVASAGQVVVLCREARRWLPKTVEPGQDAAETPIRNGCGTMPFQQMCQVCV